MGTYPAQCCTPYLENLKIFLEVFHYEVYLHRDPDNRSQKIPYSALQISQLADANELTIQADAGSILVSRDDITARQALTTIRHLYEVVDSLMEQLVDATKEISSDLGGLHDPLEDVDDDVLDDLLSSGADPDGLRMLLAMEEDDD